MTEQMNERALLYRVHFRRRPISATSGMIWAHTAKWVFRQTPDKSDAGYGYIGFEVSTRRHPYAAKEALEAATGKDWEMRVLWSRPANDGEGEGPKTGKNPWRNGWPTTDRPTD